MMINTLSTANAPKSNDLLMLSCWLSCWLSDVFTASSPCTFCSLIEPVPKSGNSWVERPVSPNQLLERPAYNIYIYTYIYTYMPLISWPDCKSLRCNSKPWRNSLKTLWASKVSSDVMFNSWPGSVVKCGQGCYQINIYYNICRSALQTFQVLDFESLKSVLPAQPELTVFPENSLSSSLLLVLEFKHLLTEGWNGANRIQSMIFLVSK